MRKLLLALLVLMFSPAMGAQAPPSHPILIPIKMQECAERDKRGLDATSLLSCTG
mgnify:CR=1 FL=1